jgi:hypothetical protein
MAQRHDIPLKKHTAAGVGVWIDSRKAVIAAAQPGEDVEFKRITTDFERQLRLPGGQRCRSTYGKQTAPSDDMRETMSKENLQVFFGDVVAALRGAQAIFIFGPGEAKDELKKRLVRDGLGARVDGVEPVGRMSDRQIAAKTRDHFRPRV